MGEVHHYFPSPLIPEISCHLGEDSLFTQPETLHATWSMWAPFPGNATLLVENHLEGGDDKNKYIYNTVPPCHHAP